MKRLAGGKTRPHHRSMMSLPQSNAGYIASRVKRDILGFSTKLRTSHNHSRRRFYVRKGDTYLNYRRSRVQIALHVRSSCAYGSL